MLSFSAMMRAAVSGAVPAGAPNTSLTGRDGQACPEPGEVACAIARLLAPSAATAKRVFKKFERFMVMSPSVISGCEYGGGGKLESRHHGVGLSPPGVSRPCSILRKHWNGRRRARQCGGQGESVPDQHHTIHALTVR